MNNEKRTISELLISLEDEKENDNEFENNTTLTDEQVKQLSEYFEVDSDDIIELTYNTYGLINIDIGSETYVLAENYDEAEEAAKEMLKDYFDEMPTGFSPWILCDNIPNSISLLSVEELIESNSNEIIKELVDVEGLIDDCISFDGAAHQLAHYDGEEIEVEGMYLYRTD